MTDSAVPSVRQPQAQETDVPGAARLAELAAELTELLRLRTLAIGLKLFEDVEEMLAIPRLRRPGEGKRFTACQLVTHARMAGLTLGIVQDNLRANSNCDGVIGLGTPGEDYLSGQRMNGVWFENQEAARDHQAGMTRVAPGRYRGLVAAPLRAARLDPPDVVMFYATPGQMILFINGLQWKSYRRYDFTVTGETACSDSWGRALATRQTSLSIPCYAERRYGGVADEELLMALPPEEFERGIAGLRGLSKAGLRYPIPPYGPFADPSEGMEKSYGGD
jgi:uncharacterized protein (DUF169 family)